MDVLIKGMELPKEGNVYLIIGEDGVVSEKIGSMYHVTTEAIELPPHGRLIDAKEFACQVYAGVCGAKNYCDYKCDSCHAKIIVDEFLPVAPTVLDASTE